MSVVLKRKFKRPKIQEFKLQDFTSVGDPEIRRIVYFGFVVKAVNQILKTGVTVVLIPGVDIIVPTTDIKRDKPCF